MQAPRKVKEIPCLHLQDLLIQGHDPPLARAHPGHEMTVQSFGIVGVAGASVRNGMKNELLGKLYIIHVKKPSKIRESYLFFCSIAYCESLVKGI